jgi:hypothetical protein
LSFFATIRQRQGPWARSVLGLFVVVWLNMALQPCAMAFGGTSNHGRTHCPPAQTEEISAQNASESDPGVSPCETSAVQCALVDDFNYDGRVVKVKVKGEPSDQLLAITEPIPVVAPERSASTIIHVDYTSIVSGDPPPLNVLYCVYLI